MTQAYPLQWPNGWERAKSRRTGDHFKVTFDQTRRELYEELTKLKAQHVVVSSWLPLRIDGTPRGDAARMKLPDPGIAVYFELRGRRMCMARDAFETVVANMRSVGLALAHLRGLERHGGAQMMDRAFEGFAQLPSLDSVHCFQTLGIRADATVDEIEFAFRRLARKAHPDKGGSHEAMAELTAARTQALETAREVSQ